MSKRGTKRTRKGDPVERMMKGVDRAVARYGASAVAKYYSPSPRSAFRPETKYFDTYFSADVNNAADWGSAVIPCTSYMNADGSTVSAYTGAALIPSAIGNGYGQVVGNKYVLKKLKVRGSIFIAHSAAATVATDPIQVRLLLIQDTQPNGAQLDLSSVFTDWGAANALINSYMSISNGTGGRVRILGDKFLTLTPSAAVNNAGATTVSCAYDTKFWKFSKSWKKGLKVVIKSGAATPAVASLSDCNIFLAAQEYSTGNTASLIGLVKLTGVARAAYMD